MMGEPKESSLALVSHGMASRPGVWGELVNLWLTGQTCMKNRGSGSERVVSCSPTCSASES